MRNTRIKQEIKHAFSQFVWFWFICWWIYCTSEFLLYLILYLDVMPKDRDYSCLCWTQCVAFFITYYILFVKKVPENGITSKTRFNPLRIVQDFFHRDHWNILFLIIFAILFETVQTVSGGSQNVATAILVLLIPSAGAIDLPIHRTLIGLSISLVSMMLSHILHHTKKISFRHR